MGEPLEPRVGERHGALVVGLVLLGLFTGCALAFVRPWLGIPLLVGVLVLAVVLLVRSMRAETARSTRVTARFAEITSPSGAAWRPLFSAFGLGGDVDAAEKRVRLALRAVDATRHGARSRFGGEPDLGPGVDWPTCGGVPLAFVGQIDLAEVHAVAAETGLPAAGLLSFFYCAPGEWPVTGVVRDGARVLFDAGTDLARRAIPADMPSTGRFDERPIAFEAFEDLPADPREACGREVSESEAATYDELRAYVQSGDTKLLGHADPIQDPAELELPPEAPIGLDQTSGPWRDGAPPRGAARLLLQVGERAPQMSWGDAGLLYYVIQPPDLESGRFERAWAIAQGH